MRKRSKLAVNGGEPIRQSQFASQNTMDNEELLNVMNVVQKGRLSSYRGNFCDEFWGGPEIQELEKEWCKKFNTKHAIAINSCTSALHAACGAIELTQNDEVIVTPYSMVCSASAPMIYGAKSVFVDIEKDNYCIDLVEVEKKITSKTKAIIAVSIFGQPYDIRINEIADKYGIVVIEDAAQAPGSYYHTKSENKPGIGYSTTITKLGQIKYAGTLGHIGCYSFNYGKHINCGEGGMIVTDNDDLAMKCRLMMNHSEAVINGMEFSDPVMFNKYKDFNMPGFNLRMTELQAAVVRAQLNKLDSLLEQRMKNVNYLNKELSKIPAINISSVRENCTHSYYVLPFQFDSKKADGLHRDVFINAVKAELTTRVDRDGEGIPIGCGYIKPLYQMQLFKNLGYDQNQCPVCEDLYENRLFLTLYHAPNSTIEDMEDVAEAFRKVWKYKGELNDL